MQNDFSRATSTLLSGMSPFKPEKAINIGQPIAKTNSIKQIVCTDDQPEEEEPHVTTKSKESSRKSGDSKTNDSGKRRKSDDKSKTPPVRKVSETKKTSYTRSRS